MAKSPQKTEYVSQIILEYLRRLYDQLRSSDAEDRPLDAQDKKNISSRERLAQYVFEQTDYPVEENLGGKAAKGKIAVSKATVLATIDKLRDENRIVNLKEERQFRYVPPEKELYKTFPILKAASNISVTPIAVDSFAFFRVGKNYAQEVTRFINRSFYPNDIYAVCLGNIIMCMDVSLPSKSRYYQKRTAIAERVLAVLNDFDICYMEAPVLEDEGVTQKEYQQEQAEAFEARAYAEFEEREKQDNEHGGALKTKRKRNIKKKESE